jgi:HSP20 family protein
MPTVIRKTRETTMQVRRDALNAVGWRIRPHAWSPPTDVYETDEAYIVRVEIAGMRDEDFDVSFANDVLFISGSRSDPLERRAYHQMEIQFGKFAIAVGVPVQFNLDEARAEYRDGFLTITLPKEKSNRVEEE